MRTNRERKKTTVYLSQDNHRDAEQIRKAINANTEAAAIRYAISFTAAAYRNQKLSPATPIIEKLIDHIETLSFVNDRERAQGRHLVAEARKHLQPRPLVQN